MKPIGCTERSAKNYHYKQRNFSEEGRFHVTRCLRECTDNGLSRYQLCYKADTNQQSELASAPAWTTNCAAAVQKAFQCSWRDVNQEHSHQRLTSQGHKYSLLFVYLCFPSLPLALTHCLSLSLSLSLSLFLFVLAARFSALLCYFLRVCLFFAFLLYLHSFQRFWPFFLLVYIFFFFPSLISSYPAFSVFRSLTCWSSTFPCLLRYWLLSSSLSFFLSLGFVSIFRRFPKIAQSDY